MAVSDNMRGILLMCVAMVSFTLNDTAMKAVLETQPLYQSLALRGIVTSFFLALIAWRQSALAGFGAALIPGRQSAMPGGRDRLLIWLRSLTEVAATLVFLAALVHMPIANLSAILQSAPLAVTLAAALVFKEQIGWRRLLAIGIGFIGVLIIVRPGSDAFSIWSVLGLVTVALMVLRDLVTRGLSRAVPTVLVALISSLAVTLTGFAGIAFEGWQMPDGRALALLMIAGLLLVVGYLTVVGVMRVGDVGVVAPFRYLSLICAVFTGWLFFDQFPDGPTLIGSGLVVASGLFMVWRERRLNRGRAALRAIAPAGTPRP